MIDIHPYLNHWKTQQKEQRLYHKKLAQEARDSLEQIIDYLIQNFEFK